MTSEGAVDQLSPAPPQAAYFDPALDLWVLSRYADVVSALRELNLRPLGGTDDGQSDAFRDHTGRLNVRGEMLEALSAAWVAKWQPRIEPVLQQMMERLPAGEPVELLSDVAKPFGLELAMLVTRAEPALRARMAELSETVFAATGAAEESELKAAAAAATAELVRILQDGPIPMGEPAFVALSQTLPSLLTNGWLALVRQPTEYASLRAHPELLPGATEELLRYAGIVRRIFRRAIADVSIGGVTIPKGQRVALQLASANRDPEQFPDPDRLDVSRPFPGHVALGTGRNSCVGALIIRMAAALATGALVRHFSRGEISRVGELRIGSGFGFPSAVWVRLFV